MKENNLQYFKAQYDKHYHETFKWFWKKMHDLFFKCFHINFKVICNGFWNCYNQF